MSEEPSDYGPGSRAVIFGPPAIEGKYYIGFSALGGVHQTGNIVESVCDGVFLAAVDSVMGSAEAFLRVVHFQEMLSWRLYASKEARDDAAKAITEAYQKRVEEAAKAQAEADAAKVENPNPNN